MNQNQFYRLDGANIYSAKTGNLVAIFADGEVVMKNGYNGQGRMVKEFLNEVFPEGIPSAILPTATADPSVAESTAAMPEDVPEDELRTAPGEPGIFIGDAPGEPGIFIGDAPAAPGSGTLGTPDNPEGSDDARFLISSIPDSELPPMDPALGISTPAVARFIKKHRMSPDQITALVRRLELKMKAL